MAIRSPTFLTASQTGWLWGWLYLGIYIGGQIVIRINLVRTNPALITECSSVERKTTRRWDQPLTGVASLFGPVAILIVSSFNQPMEGVGMIPTALQATGTLFTFGTILACLGASLPLGSWWGLIPAGIIIAALALRTDLEDRTLQAELGGYKNYADQVRYQLFPGIW